MKIPEIGSVVYIDRTKLSSYISGYYVLIEKKDNFWMVDRICEPKYNSWLDRSIPNTLFEYKTVELI